MAEILDGNKIADSIKEQLKKEFEAEKNLHKIPPKLGSIIIGEDPSSKIYVISQKKLCDEFDVEYILKEEPEDISIEKISRIIDELKGQDVAGIIAQLPLPKGISHNDIINYVGPEKDIEGLHPENMGRLFSGDSSMAACTPAAVMELLKYTKRNLHGKDAVIIGHSQIIGKPLSIMLLNEFATVTVCHIATDRRALKEHINRADILISAVGAKDFMIEGEWIKKGAIAIDVATKKINGKIVGDIDFEKAKERASYITPVPGGVGPLTNVMLMRNLLQLYKRQR